MVEGHIVGAGDSSCSQQVFCWACMAAGGCSLLCVDVVVQPHLCAARGLLGLNGGGKRLWALGVVPQSCCWMLAPFVDNGGGGCS